MKNLQKHGVSVDSYGRCMHNKEEERVKSRDHTKLHLLSRYKFSLAFENSETKDYITEKFFGSLVSGSVPVYIGAPNVHWFAPDCGTHKQMSKSVIWAGDFDFNAQKLAQYLLYLNANDTAYEQHLTWKHEGYSGDFKAMVELTSTHTSCRQCIFTADALRLKHGLNADWDQPVVTMNAHNTSSQEEHVKSVYVRERGTYRFTVLHLHRHAYTLRALVSLICQHVPRRTYKQWNNNQHPFYHRIGPALYAIYHLPSKRLIHSNHAVDTMPSHVELEVIFV